MTASTDPASLASLATRASLAARALKTTLYLDADAYRRIKRIAQRRRTTPAALVREAVAQYAERNDRPTRPRSIGAGRSGRRDLSERADELLAGMGKAKGKRR